MRARLQTGLIAMALLLGSTSVAYAYMLPNDYLLGLVDARLRKVLRVELEGTLTLGEGPAATTQAASLTVEPPGVVELTQPESSQRAKGSFWPKSEDGAALPLPFPAGLLTHWEAPPKEGEKSKRSDRVKALMAALEKVGVDPKVRSLARFDGRVVIVIGAKSWERDRPQLWVDRARRAPVRLFVREGLSADGALWDLQLLGFGSRDHGDMVPSRIEAFKGGARVARFDVEKARVNPKKGKRKKKKK